MYIIEPEVLELIPRGTRCDMPELIDSIIHENHRVISFPIREYWLDVGRREDIEKAHKFIDTENSSS